MSFLDNYEDVATRIQRFWATHPTGRIETNILDFNAEKGYVLIQCRVWRDEMDLNPAGTDMAFGNVATYNVQMKKFFVEDTATSAIGRAVGLVLGTDKRPTAQNMAQVENIDPKIVKDANTVVDLWATPLADAIGEIATKLGGQLAYEAPQCKHGHMIFRTGEKNGKDWGGWFCSYPKGKGGGEAQCNAVWGSLGSDGQWKPQS